MMNIPITKIELSERDKKNVAKVLDSGWLVQGAFVKELEKKWKGFTKAKNAIAVTNCTSALHLSLAANGISFGDEVIVPSFTWIATANAVEAVGAKPVLCDIDLTSFNINPKRIESLITSDTKAIIPVHLFGLPANLGMINEVASRYDLKVIEDAACGIGSRINNKHVGTFGHCGCFSLHPRKTITSGEGGMVTTDDDELANKLRTMRDHGANVSDLQRHIGSKPYILPEFNELGFNFRMTDLQAALAVSQMDKLNEYINRKNKIASFYNTHLREVKFLKTPIYSPEYYHSYQSFVALFDIPNCNVEELSEQRNRFMDYLLTNGISTRPGTHAVHISNYYSKKYSLDKFDFKNSYYADKCSISFPIYPSLDISELEYIVKTIKNFRV